MFNKPCPRFIYDANGQLTALEGPKRMVYIGGVYEKNLGSGEATKYYHTADGRRIAMRKAPSSGPSTLSYLANDHLSGTAVVMNEAGGMVSRTRYLPYGTGWTQEFGGGATAVPTDKLFTGQRRYGQRSGVYHYGARFYSADIGRFLQADTIVPSAGNPQTLNRYAYVLNNPLAYVDPSGNKPERDRTMSTGGYLKPSRGARSPFARAWAVVGQSSPLDPHDPKARCYKYSGRCQSQHESFQEDSRWAARFLRRYGSRIGISDVNDLPWSWDQRTTLGFDASRSGVQFRPDIDSVSAVSVGENAKRLALIAAGSVAANRAVGRAFQLHVLPNENFGHVPAPVGSTRAYLVPDAVVLDSAGNIVGIQEAKYAGPGRKVNLTSGLRDYIATEFNVTLYIPEHASPSGPLRTSLGNRIIQIPWSSR